LKVLIENDYIQITYTEKKDIPFVVETEQNQENAEYIVNWSFEMHEEVRLEIHINL